MLIKGQYDEIWPIKQARVLTQDLYTTPTFLTEPPWAPWTGLASFHILDSQPWQSFQPPPPLPKLTLLSSSTCLLTMVTVFKERESKVDNRKPDCF